MSGPAFDELLRRLVAADIRFVLIGGLAVNAWGVVRGTKDLDVVPDPAPENSIGSPLSQPMLVDMSTHVKRLRAMKRAAGRTRDLADLEELEAANGQD